MCVSGFRGSLAGAFPLMTSCLGVRKGSSYGLKCCSQQCLLSGRGQIPADCGQSDQKRPPPPQQTVNRRYGLPGGPVACRCGRRRTRGRPGASGTDLQALHPAGRIRDIVPDGTWSGTGRCAHPGPPPGRWVCSSDDEWNDNNGSSASCGWYWLG